MDPIPRFLDCEASSFRRESYPISVAWNDTEGTIHRCLIDPTPIPSWTDWADTAEAAHGIDHERLVRNGWHPDFVAGRLGEELAGQVVYSDAPDYDGRWLRRLFADTGRGEPPFALLHVDDLLMPLVKRPYEMVWQGQNRIDALKQRVKAAMSGAHDAGYDVGYLIQLHRAALGHPVKMNHGIGPLPPTTATGTFVRIKRTE